MIENLNNAWLVQSSARIEQGGAQLSTTGVDTSDWYRTDLPTTVLGALVENGQFKDLFFGTNLLRIPGHGPLAQNFSNHPMPKDSPFNTSWWFRKEFRVPKEAPKHLSLQFDGINYRANIWLNGKRIADANKIAGAYREFELDVTNGIRRRGTNVLAIEVFPPLPCDLAITWVDWNPSPPDKNTGIWRDVWLRSNGPVGIRAPHVATELEGPEKARLTIAADLVNVTGRAQTVTVHSKVDRHMLAQPVDLGPHERRRFEQELVLDHPRLWWPREMGNPELYRLDLEVVANSDVSDAVSFEFGVREVKSELTAEGHALFRVNGQPVLIRGAGWATDMLLRRMPERDRAQLEYVKAMNLNAIRFEGMTERSGFIEWCDREGIMIIAGWCCCDAWEKWDGWSKESHLIAAESLRSQARRLRRHPSVIAFWYGSDFSPPPKVERQYLDVLRQERWPNPKHSSAADKPTEITGPSGMKMMGPYEYVPPNYWTEDTAHGGAFGFATEISPGPAVPPIESLRKMIPKNHLWPIDDVWNFHAGIVSFSDIKIFTNALFARYGKVDNVEQFAELSQLMTYEGERAMFEAYTRNRFKATGVVQWMLNNSWPSLIWHLYDYFLRPGGGFFGTQKACEPLHVMYAYDNASVVVANSHPQEFAGLKVQARVWDLDHNEVFARSVDVDVPAAGNARAFQIPRLDRSSPIYFVDLRLFGPDDALLSRNFYWIPSELDILDHANASWHYTPISKYADLTALRDLPKTKVSAKAAVLNGGPGASVRVELANPTEDLAFFVQMRLADENGEDILPVLWSDNYVSLPRADTCVVHASLPDGIILEERDLHLHLRGLNVPDQDLVINSKKEKTDEQDNDDYYYRRPVRAYQLRNGKG